MRILCLSDTHGKHGLLKNLPQADVIIHAGDVTSDGSERSAVDFMDWFSKLDCKYKVFIAGNHDWFFEREPPAYIQKNIPENVVYLNDSGVSIEGVNFWGSPISPEFFNWAFNRKRGREINKHWKLIPKNTDVLITHGPPFGILDNVYGRPVGCEELAKRVETIQPKLHLFGHIHGEYGQLVNGETQYVNASVLNDHYQLVNAPVLIEV